MSDAIESTLRDENTRLRIEVGLLRREKQALEDSMAHVMHEFAGQKQRRVHKHRRWFR
jgi:hypothetical protein